MTNVPTPTLTATGYTMPTEQDILAGVIMDLQAAFGGTLNLSLNNTSSLSTPQGQLATSMAACIADCYSAVLNVCAQVDPQYAQGLMQDAIGNIWYMQRLAATGTTVTGYATGIVGTVIGSGIAVAVDAAGSLYQLLSAVTLTSGSTPLLLVNMAPGPTAYVGPMTIYQVTPGWDAIASSVQATLGNNTENAQQFELRRAASVAANSTNTAQAIRGAILQGQYIVPAGSFVAGNQYQIVSLGTTVWSDIGASSAAVGTLFTATGEGSGTGSASLYGVTNPPSSVYVFDNSSNVAVTQGGITVPGNSIYVSAYGGSAALISQAIWIKKSLGCSYAPSAIFVGSVSGVTLTVTSVSSGALAIGQTLLSAPSSLPYFNAGAPVTIIGGAGTSWTLSATPGTLSGITMWSATTVTTYDTTFPSPQPTYYVSYTQPVAVPINVQVTLAAASYPPSNSLALLQASSGLALAFTGADGGSPVAQIGATVYASRFYTTVAQVIPGASIISVLIGTGTPSATQVATNINQIPSLGTITLVLT